MPRVIALHHTTIVVRDLDNARWFYGQVLGLRELERTSDITRPGMWFDCNNAQLHIVVANESLPVPAQRHFALEVEDFDDTVEVLQKHGVRITRGPGKRGDGSNFLTCVDPEGNTLEITGR